MTGGVRPLRTDLYVKRPKGAAGADQATLKPRNVGFYGQQVADRPILRGVLK